MSSSISPDSSSSPSAGSRPAAARTETKKTRLAVAIAAAVLCLIVGFFVIRSQGFVSGSEFAPSHFQQRHFRFYEIPLLHMQITPIKRSVQTSKTATYLRQKSLVTTGKGDPATWHLVSISRGLTGATDADANLLVDQMMLYSEGDEYWRSWSMDHPKHAKVLWPVIQKLAERELYLLMPPIFELAQLKQSSTELQRQIDNMLRSEYRSLVQDMQDAGREDLANSLLEEARNDYPEI